MFTLKGKKVIVTGGTGFIGRQVVSRLLEGDAKVICLTRKKLTSDNPNLNYIQCDLKSISRSVGKELRESIGSVDYIIYLAASIPDFSEQAETMVGAKENTLDPLVNFLAIFGNLASKIVFTSTIDVYGKPPVESMVTEDTQVAPDTPYAVAKLCSEYYLKFFCKKNEKKYVILRLSQVYGPNEPMLRVIPFIINSAISNDLFTLIGDGADKRRFIYVDDAARAIIQSLQYNKNNLFIISGNEDISIRQVILTVENVLSTKLQVENIEANKKPVDILPVADKAVDSMGFQPEVSFREGIELILRKYDEYEG